MAEDGRADLLSAAGDGAGDESLSPGEPAPGYRAHLTALLRPFGDEIAETSSRILIAAFGSLVAVLDRAGAPAPRAAPRGAGIVAALTDVRAAMMPALRYDALLRPGIAGAEDLARYLRAEIGHRPSEQLGILFLATGNRLLADEARFNGSVASASMLPRPIVHRALDLEQPA